MFTILAFLVGMVGVLTLLRLLAMPTPLAQADPGILYVAPRRVLKKSSVVRWRETFRPQRCSHW